MALHRKNTTTKNTATASTRPRRGISRRGVTLAGLLAAAALAVGAAVPAAASAAVTRPASAAHDATAAQTSGTAGGVTQFGMADPDLLGESASTQAAQLAGMKAIGITEIRLDANWDWVQYGGKNSFDWSQLDQAVASVRAAGMSLDLIIDGCPPWAAVSGTSGDDSPQPASSAQFAQWASEVAARYAPQGVSTFEIWNEPNNVGFWQPAPNPAAYTADLIAAYKAIKKVDPSAFVLSGGLAPETNDGTNINPVTFLQDMYADGARGYFDGVAYHPYSYPALPDTYESWSGWSEMNQTSPSIRSVMAANGDSGKQIYITEVGAPSGGPSGVGLTAQAEDYTQAIAAAKTTSWIGGMYLYTWQDDGTDTTNSEDWFGLLTYAGAQTPAYTAVKNAIG
jgi:polysaccharide biosynthesis protein PslG